MSGSSQAGWWVLVLIIYFLAVTVFSYFYVGASGELGAGNGGIVLNTPFAQQQNAFLQEDGFCSNPRNEDFGGIVYQFDSLDCRSMRIVNQGLCGATTGCTWTNTTETSFFGLIEYVTNASCQGTISIPYLRNNSATVSIWRPDESGYLVLNATSFYSALGNFFTGTQLLRSNELPGFGQAVSVCEMPRVQDEGVCAQYGCTWFDSSRADVEKPNTFGQTIQFMFGFGGSFATDSTFADFILRLLFIYLPLTILGIAVAMFARG